MTTPSAKPRKRKRRSGHRTWKAIVLDVFVQHVTQENTKVFDYDGVTLDELYALVAAHPDVKPRLEQLPNLRANVRQVCQQLRDAGLVEHVRRGVWKLRDAS